MPIKIYIENNYFIAEDTSNGNEIVIQEPKSLVRAIAKGNQLQIWIDSPSPKYREFDRSELLDENDALFASDADLNTFVRLHTGFNSPQEGGVTSQDLQTVEDGLQSQINLLGSVSPEDAFYVRRDEVLDEGANLYNKNDPDNNNSGWLNALNQVQAHATATHTKYFSLIPNQDYWYLNAYGASTSLVIVDDSFQVVRAITGTVNDTFTAAASGESYVRFSVRDINDFMFAKGSVVGSYEPFEFRIKPEVIDDNLFKDKGIVTFGDSITWFSTGWTVTFNELVNPQYVDNRAVSGQRIAWNGNTVDTGTTPANDSGDNNVLWNSIKGWEATNSNGDPDAIILAIGTNDISQNSTLGSFNDAYAQDEASTPQTTMAGAFRKALYYLTENYPNTQIFYCTPLQSKTGGRNYTTISNVGDINTAIAKRFNARIIDVTNGSGITDEFENASAVGRYLYDGTHPSYPGNTNTTLPGAELGSVRMARFIASEFKKQYVF
ncbi:MAG: SGNH/GDSL hydrolase family protein [bacterium]